MTEMLLGHVDASADHVMRTGMLQNVGVRSMCRDASRGTMRVHNPSEVLPSNREQSFTARFSCYPRCQSRFLIEQSIGVLDQLLDGSQRSFQSSDPYIAVLISLTRSPIASEARNPCEKPTRINSQSRSDFRRAAARTCTSSSIVKCSTTDCIAKEVPL